MKRTGWSVVLAGALAAIFGLGYLVGIVRGAESDARALALAPWANEPGFLADATIYVIPIVPPKKAEMVESIDLYPALSDQVRRAADWFNSGAQGRRTIFKHVNGAPPEVLRPIPKTDESAGGKHDCQNLIDKAMATGSALGAGNVAVLLADKTWKCPFTGLAGFRGNWVVITGWNPNDLTFDSHTLVHELGHTIGLPHARAYDCAATFTLNEEQRSLATCDVIEYGDPTDPMGAAVEAVNPGLNAFNRYMLGWDEAPEVIDTPGVTKVRIPVVTGPGPGYVEIPGGFLLSYRAPTGEVDDADAGLRWHPEYGNLAGVYLHRKASDRNDASTYPVLLPMHSDRLAAQVGDHFVSEESNVSFVVKDIEDGKYADVVVHVGTKNKTTEDKWGPILVLHDMGDMFGEFYYVEWTATDPSGVEEMYALVDGRRQTVGVWGGVVVPYRDRPQRVTMVAIDKEGNLSVSRKFTIPAR